MIKKANIYFIFFIVLVTTLVSCSKDDEKEITVTPEFLNGTIWKGSFKSRNDLSYKMVISFINKEKGTVRIYRCFGSNFNYKVNSKNIEFDTESNDYYNYFKGVWWIDKVDENSLILFSHDEVKDRKIITLTKTFGDKKK